MPQGATKPTSAVIEWDQFYTEQLTIWHLILAEDHLLFWYANGPDQNCAGCLVWHGEKMKAMVAIEAPKFFSGKHLETYREIGSFAQRVQDKILSDKLTQPLAHEYALRARQLRYDLAKFKTYDFSSGELASLLALLEEGNHNHDLDALLNEPSGGITMAETSELGQILEQATRTKTIKHSLVPYGDKVRFFIDDSAKTAVPFWASSTAKGWADVFVGEYRAKARHYDTYATQHELVLEHYPAHTNQRYFYDDLSYHSPINKGEAGKISTYGMSKYHIGFSLYEAGPTYKLLHPVRTSKKAEFGKVVHSVRTFTWHYVVLDWYPKWHVKYTIHYPDGRDKAIFKSKEFEKPEDAKPLFMQKVEELKATIKNAVMAEDIDEGDYPSPLTGEAELEARSKPRKLPDFIQIFNNAIRKHYRPSQMMHKGSIRLAPSPAGVSVIIGCPKSSKYNPSTGTCSKQAVVETIVRKTADELDKVKVWKSKGVKVTRINRDYVEPRRKAGVPRAYQGDGPEEGNEPNLEGKGVVSVPQNIWQDAVLIALAISGNGRIKFAFPKQDASLRQAAKNISDWVYGAKS